jgi:peroxiredoxin Q/BCP
MKLNDKVKAFSTIDTDGNTISDKNLKGKWTVFYFYPKDLTPGCTVEACTFRDLNKDFAKLEAQIFGKSKDTQTLHKRFTDKHELNFPLLVDSSGDLCNMFGVWQLKKLYGKEYMGILRQSFIINPDLKVVKIYEKVNTKTHADEVLNDLKMLQMANK